MTKKNPALHAPELVDVKTAAEYLGVHVMTVRRWIYQGRLPAHRVGPTLIRIYVDDLVQLGSGAA